MIDQRKIQIDKRFIAECSDGITRLCIKYIKETYPHWELIKIIEENGRNVEGEKGAIDVDILSLKYI